MCGLNQFSIFNVLSVPQFLSHIASLFLTSQNQEEISVLMAIIHIHNSIREILRYLIFLILICSLSLFTSLHACRLNHNAIPLFPSFL